MPAPSSCVFMFIARARSNRFSMLYDASFMSNAPMMNAIMGSIIINYKCLTGVPELRTALCRHRHRQQRAGRQPHHGFGGRTAQRGEKAVMPGRRHADQVGVPVAGVIDNGLNHVAVADGDRQRLAWFGMALHLRRVTPDMSQAVRPVT